MPYIIYVHLRNVPVIDALPSKYFLTTQSKMF